MQLGACWPVIRYVILLSVFNMLWLFDDQIFVDFVGLLSMIIYEVLYTQCLRYNICSTWF